LESDYLILVAVCFQFMKYFSVLGFSQRCPAPTWRNNRHPSGILNTQPLGTEAARGTLGGPGVEILLRSCV